MSWFAGNRNKKKSIKFLNLFIKVIFFFFFCSVDYILMLIDYL